MTRTGSIASWTIIAGLGLTGLTGLSASVTADAADTTCTIAAAGDVAGQDDYLTGAERTAQLIEREQPVAVLALGDLAYDAGTAEEFAKYYDPTWGRFRQITKPTPGNHEYYTASDGKKGFNATAYFDYFDVDEQYSFDVCGWHVVSLNSETKPKGQVKFLEEDLAAHPVAPLIVYWHRPRFSSGSEHGGDPDQQKLWAAATRAGADLVLVAHDHHYERFAPMDASGDRSPGGTRQFVSGGGGHHPRSVGRLEPNSEKEVGGMLGVLFLDLRPASYSWAFKSPDGTVHDSGSSPATAG